VNVKKFFCSKKWKAKIGFFAFKNNKNAEAHPYLLKTKLKRFLSKKNKPLNSPRRQMQRSSYIYSNTKS
jgi:hypothetical protein